MAVNWGRLRGGLWGGREFWDWVGFFAEGEVFDGRRGRGGLRDVVAGGVGDEGDWAEAWAGAGVVPEPSLEGMERELVGGGVCWFVFSFVFRFGLCCSDFGGWAVSFLADFFGRSVSVFSWVELLLLLLLLGLWCFFSFSVIGCVGTRSGPEASCEKPERSVLLDCHVISEKGEERGEREAFF